MYNSYELNADRSLLWKINTKKEKYEKAMPLCYYLDSKNEENLMNFTWYA